MNIPKLSMSSPRTQWVEGGISSISFYPDYEIFTILQQFHRTKNNIRGLVPFTVYYFLQYYTFLLQTFKHPVCHHHSTGDIGEWVRGYAK